MVQITKNNITYWLIAVLVAIILLQRSCSVSNEKGLVKETVKTDTVWKETKDTVFKTVKVTDVKYIPLKDEKYTVSDNCDSSKVRFQNLLKEHLVRTVYADTIKLDSLGTIVVKDTVWLNKLYGKREYIKDYKIPFVTKTIVKKEDPRRQMYIGGNGFIGGSGLLTPGLIYKDRKDRVYQANVGVGFDGSINYGFGMYWKINLRGNGNK
jgi:hypothetical protein